MKARETELQTARPNLVLGEISELPDAIQAAVNAAATALAARTVQFAGMQEVSAGFTTAGAEEARFQDGMRLARAFSDLEDRDARSFLIAVAEALAAKTSA